MSTNHGIFEPYGSPQPSAGGLAPLTQPTPFSVVAAKQPLAFSSPFAIAPQNSANPSPFSVVQQAIRHTPIPEPRLPQKSPFQIGEPHRLGYDAQFPNRQGQFAPAALFSPVPAPPKPQYQNPPPFSFAPEQLSATPPPQPAISTNFPPQAFQQPSHSQSIRQLELRAIFGVNHELSKDEIIQRARTLPGIKHIAIVNDADIAAFDAIQRMLFNMGIPAAPIKLFAGPFSIEFIREGRILLAIQTDGFFTQGVREALMLIAKELSC